MKILLCSVISNIVYLALDLHGAQRDCRKEYHHVNAHFSSSP